MKTSLLSFAALAIMQTTAFGAESYTLANGNTNPFTVNYTSIASQTAVTATATFTPSNWTFASGVSTFDLLMAINNTTIMATGGRLTGMGFSTTPDSQTPDPNYNVTILDYIAGGSPNALSNEIFRQVNYGTTADLPQVASGLVDFCVFAKANGGNCNGAGSGNDGIEDGTTKTSKLRISYSGNSAFSFDKFYARFQSLSGQVTSDVGKGTLVTNNDPVVPEPSFYAALSLGATGLMFAVRRRKSQA